MWEYSRLFGWQPCRQFQACSSLTGKVSVLRLASSKHTDKNNPCPFREGVWKSGGLALIILNLGNIGKYWQLHVPAALIPGDKFLTPPGIEERFLGRQARRPVVTICTTRLSVHKAYVCPICRLVPSTAFTPFLQCSLHCP